MKYIFLFYSFVIFLSYNSQTNNDKDSYKPIDGPCQGCEAIYEYGNEPLSNLDTFPDFEYTGPKLKVTGIVYQKDGKTPAADVIVYAYHTDRNGIYPKKENSKGWERRHGYLRAWVKTNADGKYTFYTFRPAAYPNRDIPEHIHLTIKEPNKNEYYIDDVVFDDDPLLTTGKRKKRRNRGGSGIVVLEKESDLLLGRRDIILGRNIPDYR
ncbi:MAG: intradiol ring-cleavage dioxygenase [Bacteroidota bacterium]